MELEQAIRTRRTHKAYGDEPVERGVLDELFELARWAPNHNLTNPWRFRVLGPKARERLREAADALDPGSGAKLDRAPTLVVASAEQCGEAVADSEDRDAAAIATYIVMLAAHARGLASYWRTPAVLQGPTGREALGIPPHEAILGLIHLGPPRHDQRIPERQPPESFVTYLD